MSPKVREQLKAYIRELIQQEIEEASTTATAGAMHYSTPYAFSGKGKKDRRKKIANQSGYKLVGKFHVKVQDLGSVLVDAGSKGEAKMKVAKQLKKRKDIVSVTRVGVSKAKQVDKKLENVNEGKYHDWRNDETLSPKQKIGKSMMEVRDTLRELEKMVKMNVRLKNELNVDSRGYWKRTHSALQKISERLVKLANKVGQLK